MLGVDARAEHVRQERAGVDGRCGRPAPGTLFISNDPATVAIGRLADQATWLTLRFDVDLWLTASLMIGFCLEIVEDGPKGFALAVRIEGGIGKKGVVRLTYNAGWGVRSLVVHDRLVGLRGESSRSRRGSASCCSASCASASARGWTSASSARTRRAAS